MNSIRREKPLDFLIVFREAEEAVEEGEELLCERGPGERSWGIVQLGGVKGSEVFGTYLRALLRGIVA